MNVDAHIDAAATRVREGILRLSRTVTPIPIAMQRTRR